MEDITERQKHVLRGGSFEQDYSSNSNVIEARQNDFDIGGLRTKFFETTPFGSLENSSVLQISLFSW